MVEGQCSFSLKCLDSFFSAQNWLGRYAHYHKSLELNAENFGTWGYLGQYYVLQGDRENADLCLDTLCRAVGPAHLSTEVPPAQSIYSIFGSGGAEISIENIPELAAVLP